MSSNRIFLNLPLIFISFFSLNIFANQCELPQTALESFKWEYFYNSANDKRSKKLPQKFKIKHFNIPTKLLNYRFDLKTNPKINEALLFYKNGEEYVRWIVNPEDTKYYLQIKKFLVSHGYNDQQEEYFVAYRTSSRSIYLCDPKNNYFFSGKVSTNKTGGKFGTDKGVDIDEVKGSYYASKLTQKIMKGKNIAFNHLMLLNEPIGFHISWDYRGYYEKKVEKKRKLGKKRFKIEKGVGKVEVDQGFIIRDISPLISRKYYYLPGFSAIHESLGPFLADLNNSYKSPFDYWNKHYVRPLGRAIAELIVHTGFTMTSAHSQQYLIQLDNRFKPTGKIVVRDFNDSQLFLPFYKKSKVSDKYQEMLDFWQEPDRKRRIYLKPFLRVWFGVLHGSVRPSWISFIKYPKMIYNFFDSFERRFFELTDIPLETLEKGQMRLHWKFTVDYTSKLYYKNRKMDNNKDWADFFKYSDCFRGQEYFRDISCKDILINLFNYNDTGKKRKMKDQEDPSFKYFYSFIKRKLS